MTVKHAGIRAGLCWTKEIAYLTRLHNDANVVSIQLVLLQLNKQ
jgi:ribose 5-phosphate isomerase B